MRPALPSFLLQQRLVRELRVIELTGNPEGRRTLRHAGNLSDALDTEFFCALAGDWNQDFNTNIGSHGWTTAAEDQRSVYGDIVCKPPLRMFRTVRPVKNYGKAELVSNTGSALNHHQLDNGTVGHWRSQVIPELCSGQSAECLEIT
jgi:hypothetical protein